MTTGATLVRRVAALKAKLASLTDEATSWSKSTDAGPLKYHASQIEDVSGGLREMHADIAAAIAELEKNNAFSLPEVERLERRILAALYIWEFYRDKFLLRLVADLTEPLALVDDLAWQAYRPPRDLAVRNKKIDAVDVREPPLVFPNVRWSPFASPRHTAYELNETSGQPQALDGFDRWLKAVPVPLVGIPWYQLAHLPDAVFIGHEVGHLVLDDFGLEDPVGDAIAANLPNATSERRSAWSARWLSETFADVYGVLTTGSAYVAVLLDLIAGDANAIAAEHQPDDTRPGSPWGDYPPRALRARLVCEALRQLPAPKETVNLFTQRANELEAAWVGAHPGNAMAAYVEDIEPVVRSILTTPLIEFGPGLEGKGVALTAVLPFTGAMETQARKDANDANGMKPVVASDIRVLFAGVAHAFVEDPARFVKNETQSRFLARMKQYRTQGKRGAVPGFNAAAPSARHKAMAKAIDLILSRQAKDPHHP